MMQTNGDGDEIYSKSEPGVISDFNFRLLEVAHYNMTMPPVMAAFLLFVIVKS